MEEKPRKRHLIQRRKCGKKYGDTAILEERAEQEILEIIRILIRNIFHKGKKKLTKRVIAREYNTSMRRNLKK